MILSHGRPDNQRTLRALTKAGWTGPVKILLDTDDTTVDEYRARYGDDMILTFDKGAAVADTADPTDDRRIVVYARNESQRIARDLGWDYLFQLDDDYNHFAHRYVVNGTLRYAYITDLDGIVSALREFQDTTGAHVVAMAQGGDFIGGGNTRFRQGLIRKAMNTMLIDTTRPVTFMGRINEDVNAYVVNGSRGELYFTATRVSIEQPDTQSSAGGLTDAYLDSGTYVKSFYTVMMAPSCVKVTRMGETSKRFHHEVTWDHAVPKILSDRHRKAQPRAGRPRAKA